MVTIKNLKFIIMEIYLKIDFLVEKHNFARIREISGRGGKEEFQPLELSPELLCVPAG